MERGEVRWVEVAQPWGRRPVLLIARDTAYPRLTWVCVAPITTTIRRLETAVLLTVDEDGVLEDCCVSLDNLMSVRTSDLAEVICRLSEERMRQVDKAIHAALDLSY